ncbi:MAG: cupin domain-containing protein [Bacteroidota bacterium]
MRTCLLLTLFSVFGNQLLAQVAIADTLPPTPFKIDQRYLSGLDLPKIDLKDKPDLEYFQKRIYKGTDLSIYMLGGETKVNQLENFGIDEFVYYLSGRADITAASGNVYQFYGGDYLFVPKGFTGQWINNGGSQYHLELSVITNKRSDSARISPAKEPFLLDRNMLSGIDQHLEDAMESTTTIYEGVELRVYTHTEYPGKRAVVNKEQEELIHILKGVLTILPEGGEKQTYYTGDFFVLPKGFTGSWESESADTFRTLNVTRTIAFKAAPK